MVHEPCGDEGELSFQHERHDHQSARAAAAEVFLLREQRDRIAWDGVHRLASRRIVDFHVLCLVDDVLQDWRISVSAKLR